MCLSVHEAVEEEWRDYVVWLCMVAPAYGCARHTYDCHPVGIILSASPRTLSIKQLKRSGESMSYGCACV